MEICAVLPGADAEGLGVGKGKESVSGGQLCRRCWAGSGRPCPVDCCAAVGYLRCALLVPMPHTAPLAPCRSWAQSALLLHARQVGQAATTSQMPHHKVERDWENTCHEQAVHESRPNPSTEFARKFFP